MTREEAKELLPIMQAFAEGKTIEFRAYGGAWKVANTPTWSSHLIYRIKPEPKYRPFKTKEECWNEMQKHQPLGWVKRQDKKSYILFCSVNDNCDFEVDFLDFTFVDGTPFGIKEE